MSKADIQFLNGLREIMANGEWVETRNSKVIRSQGIRLRFDNTPLVKVRKTAWKYALLEWEWFMTGSNKLKDLDERVHHWWQPFVNDQNEIPNNYGQQLRHCVGRSNLRKVWSDYILSQTFPEEINFNKQTIERELQGFDQVQAIIDGIKNHPYSRRNVITTWNSADMWDEETTITNCHNTATQFLCSKDGRLHCLMTQRSGDYLLGIPHNLTQLYAFLLYICHHTNKTPGLLTWFGNDCHVYENHVDMANKILKQNVGELPEINLQYNPTSDSFKADDFSLDRKYEPLIKEKLPMSV